MAEAIGLPLTLFVTINFAVAGVTPETAVAMFEKLRASRFNKWAQRPGKDGGKAFPPTYAYAFENSRDGVAFDETGPGLEHNTHVHWIVHVPPARRHAFEVRLHSWLDELTGTLTPANAISIRAVNNRPSLRGYVLKGANAAWAERFGSEAVAQGLVLGRRSGTSLNLGIKARLRYDRAHGIDRLARLKRRAA